MVSPSKRLVSLVCLFHLALWKKENFSLLVLDEVYLDTNEVIPYGLYVCQPKGLESSRKDTWRKPPRRQTKWSQIGYMSALINQRVLNLVGRTHGGSPPTPLEFQPLLRYIPSPGALYITYIKCMKSTFIYIYMHKLSCYIDLAIWVVLLINNKLPVLVKLSKIYWCVRSIAFTTLSAYHLWIFFFFFNKMNCRLFELGISWEVVQLKLKGHRRCLDGLKGGAV